MTENHSCASDAEKRSKHAIVYITDVNFLPFSSYSILSHTESVRRECDFFMFVDDSEAADLDPYYTALSPHLRRIEIAAKDISEAGNWDRSRYIPPVTFGRLFMHDWIPATYERVLFIDGDTLAGPVAVDMNEDLGQCVLGAVEDYGYIAKGKIAEARQVAGLAPEGRFFNAGVLLIDWPQWLKLNIGEQALEMLRTGRSRVGDQMLLNRLCDGNWKPLSPGWNVHPEQFRDRVLMRSARILHFTGSKKPWFADRWKYDERYCDFYLERARNGPFAIPVRQKTLLSSILRRLRKIVPRWMDKKYWRYTLYRRTRKN